MGQIIPINDINEFFEAMRAGEEAAIARTSPRGKKHQAAAKERPTWWFRVTQDEPEGLLIVGKSQPVEYQIQREIELGGLEDRTEEDIRRDFQQRADRGWLFGWCYSKVCPEGELGSTHVSDVFWMDEQLFEDIKEIDWCLHHLLRDDFTRGTELALRMNRFAELDFCEDGGPEP